MNRLVVFPALDDLLGCYSLLLVRYQEFLGSLYALTNSSIHYIPSKKARNLILAFGKLRKLDGLSGSKERLTRPFYAGRVLVRNSCRKQNREHIRIDPD